MESLILEKIYSAILKFLMPTDPEDTYALMVEEATKLVGGDCGRIILEEEGTLNLVYASSPVAQLPKVVRKTGFVYTCFSKRQAFLVDKDQIASVYPSIAKKGIKSGLLIPLSFRNKAIGVLVVESYSSKRFTPKELKVLKLFGAIASLAVRNVHLFSELKKSLKNRDLFISLAAHELRTPVTTVHGYSQLLYGKNKGKDSTEARWIAALHAESYRLTLLIRDLLEINHIKSGNFSYEYKECSLNEIIRRAVDNIKFNYPEREVVVNSFLSNKGDKIIGDFNKLLQVVINLLDNAVKFSPEKTHIKINLKYRPPNYILQVRDYGKGIAQKDLPKVFEEFYRGSEDTYEGMGLGLFLSKKIIEAHRGTIHMHSRVGKGTLVEVQLPRARV